MSKKRVESYIPKVLEVLERSFDNGVVPASYNGYISSFGASVMQSGLLPTLALFENTNASTRENKEYLSYIIFQVLSDSREDRSLLRYVLEQDNPLHREEIIDIAIAIKLCIRTFKLEKGGEDG